MNEHIGQGWDDDNHRSRNASLAYADGEKPISKWRAMDKDDFIQAILEDASMEDDKELKQALEKISKEDLMDHFLTYTGWHHIGAGTFTRVVSFYGLITGDAYNFLPDSVIEAREKQAKAEEIVKAQALIDSRDFDFTNMNGGLVMIYAKGDLFKDNHIVKLSTDGKTVLDISDD